MRFFCSDFDSYNFKEDTVTRRKLSVLIWNFFARYQDFFIFQPIVGSFKQFSVYAQLP